MDDKAINFSFTYNIRILKHFLCFSLHLSPLSPHPPPFPPFLRVRQVPSVLLSTSAVPAGLAVRGRGCLVQTRVCSLKRKMKGEENAFHVSKVRSYDTGRWPTLIC